MNLVSELPSIAIRLTMEVFGGVAAAVTLAAQLLELGRKFKKMCKEMREAPSDFEQLADEMAIFAGLFGDFLDTCAPDLDMRLRRPSPEQSLVAWVRRAVRDYKKLRQNAPVFNDRSNYPVLQDLKARFQWYKKAAVVQWLRTSLRVARESMNGFMNVRLLEKLDEELRLLRNTTKEVRLASARKGLSIKTLEGRM